MKGLSNRRYAGTGERKYKPLEGAWEKREPYIASSDLAEAVNMAIYLGRPLLLEGDPGVGKTRLAYAIAYELGYPLLPIYIRSTSRAQDLLYTFDAVRRLYDIQERLAIQVGKTEGDVAKQATASQDKNGVETATQDIAEKRKYVKLGRLGEAIGLSEKNTPSVVLIDEIDKADIDFPNDLLLVLDRLQFEIEEIPNWNFDALQQQTREDRRAFLPLVIITSNREKELPAPFLRRCLFYYINFPGESELSQIVKSHFKQARVGRLFEEALKKFWKLHQQKTFTWRKAPSTSELLDWLAALERSERGGGVTAETLAGTSLGSLPHLEALVKTQSDLDALSRMQEEHEPVQGG